MAREARVVDSELRAHQLSLELRERSAASAAIIDGLRTEITALKAAAPVICSTTLQLLHRPGSSVVDIVPVSGDVSCGVVVVAGIVASLLMLLLLLL